MNYLEAPKEMKILVNKLTREAVKSGKIEKVTICSCGSGNMVVPHHADYTKPYDVEWLCGACHRLRHMKRHPKIIKESATKPVAMTTSYAAKAYGVAELQLARMCLKGKRLERLYGKDIPVEELATALFAKKVGRAWFIPITELNRIFLP